MKPIAYFIIIDLVLVVFFIKLIFKSTDVFMKAVLGHILGDFDCLATFRRWEKEHDISHKMNLFYTALIAITGLSILAWHFLF
jgi:hypothetical protein